MSWQIASVSWDLLQRQSYSFFRLSRVSVATVFRRSFLGLVALGYAFLMMVVFEPKAVWSQPPESSVRTSSDLEVLVLDQYSQPVEGARIGFSASFGDSSYESPSWIYLPDPASQESFPRQTRTGKRGTATLSRGMEILRDFRISLVARHEGRQLSGIVNFPRNVNEKVTIILHPECRVYGKLACQELAEDGIELERNSLSVSLDGRLCVEHYSLAPDFEIFLPPGEYSMTAIGANDGTLVAKRSFSISDGVAELKLYPMELSLKGSKKLLGQPAPDFADVIAWKGTGPKSLKDLRGKVVLLDFWGYWCHACIVKIPRLIELDNRYREHGLQILGLHIDAGKTITSISEYDEFAESLKDGILEGKNITYPVALIAEKPTPFRGNSMKDATCRMASDYGVINYPTMILIDRDGNVAGEFRDTPEGYAKLEALLGMPERKKQLDR
ncbi:TlpA family protein disulfide reductase [Roseiconus lacunae]|uniref:TlpA disulfide reductase family protein n=1 Tax=Roseiconus lacunae TaxID=2605694 RepID=A0ABT7PSC8_9BACT|nr:TlpA disulfide reductase family protein [Roseiconus lacunae]MDM4019404.1 TlpA disulfide reductase family protein [Roseiconus lacunae]